MGQSGDGRGQSRVFAEVFQSRANSLNFLRFVMASGVIVFHSFALSGYEVSPWPVYQLLGYVWVDGFFAISGYLILRSWLSRPDWRVFLSARALRIYPAFWVCLLMTAFVIAPIGVMLQSGSTYLAVVSGENFRYVWANASLVVTQYDISGTPLDVPHPGTWNGSLWTLAWEFLCYLGVLALGLIGAFRFRWAVPAAFGVALVAEGMVSIGIIENSVFVLASRFGLMFTAGMMIKRFDRVIPVRPIYVFAAGAVVIATMLLPAYRPVGALFLAYAILSAGALIRNPRLRFENDISYGTYVYAFPLQQLLACAGLAAAGPVVFLALSFVIVLPVAALSWFVVEKPTLRLKRRFSTRAQTSRASVP